MVSNKEGIEDCLVIGYDQAKGKDHTCLIVSRPIGNGAYQIINEYKDKEAEEIYKKLKGGNTNANLF